MFTLNSLALPFRTQRPIEVWRSGSGGRSSYGNAGVWPHRHEAFGPGLSVLGFGCGAVGGLMVRGDWRDQERTVARAIGTTSTLRCGMAMENSEKNLGSVPQKLKPANVVVGTKVRLRSQDFGHIPTP